MFGCSAFQECSHCPCAVETFRICFVELRSAAVDQHTRLKKRPSAREPFSTGGNGFKSRDSQYASP